MRPGRSSAASIMSGRLVAARIVTCFRGSMPSSSVRSLHINRGREQPTNAERVVRASTVTADVLPLVSCDGRMQRARGAGVPQRMRSVHCASTDWLSTRCATRSPPSPPPPSPLLAAMLSISSKKTMDGAAARAFRKISFTAFSLSPTLREEANKEKEKRGKRKRDEGTRESDFEATPLHAFHRTVCPSPPSRPRV